MPTYLYCLLPAASEAPPADVAGVTGERVRRLAIGEVAAWVGTADAAVVDRTPEVARRHDAVVRAALGTGVTPLPARGGQWFDDDARCAAAIAGRGAMISAALDRVAGCVEMSLHVISPEGEALARGSVTGAGPSRPAPPIPPAATPGRGREYLEDLRARREMEHKLQLDLARARDVIASDVQALVRGEAVGHAEGRGELTLYHLVPRTVVVRYRDAAAAAAARHPFRIRVRGPYAPYSFSEIRG